MTTGSKDELFQILSNSRRRHIIYYLAEAGEPLSLNRLATKIAAAESGTPEAEITSEERQRVYISLYQTHLPKLEEGGIVSYDEDERTVSLTDEIREEGFFWMDTGVRSGWLRYYLALAAASWLLVVAVWLVPGVAAVGWAAVAVAVSLGLSAVAALQYRAARGAGEGTTGYETLVE
jgi:DNA-binding transcriptional ArsR family regulator